MRDGREWEKVRRERRREGRELAAIVERRRRGMEAVSGDGGDDGDDARGVGGGGGAGGCWRQRAGDNRVLCSSLFSRRLSPLCAYLWVISTINYPFILCPRHYTPAAARGRGRLAALGGV